MVYERKPKWFPLIGRSLRDGPALLPVYGWDFLKKSLEATFGRPGRQVAAGVNPAAKATLEIGRSLRDGHPALMTARMVDPSMARAGALLPVYGWDFLK